MLTELLNDGLSTICPFSQIIYLSCIWRVGEYMNRDERLGDCEAIALYFGQRCDDKATDRMVDVQIAGWYMDALVKTWLWRRWQTKLMN